MKINCHTAIGAEVFACERGCTVDGYDDDKDGDVPRDHHTTSGDVTRAQWRSLLPCPTIDALAIQLTRSVKLHA